MKSLSTRQKQNIFFFVGIISILLVWLIITLFDDNIFFPGIGEVVVDLGKLLSDGNNWLIILYTFLKVIFVIVVSFIISFVLAILSYKVRSFRAFISPFIALCLRPSRWIFRSSDGLQGVPRALPRGQADRGFCGGEGH